MRLKSVSALAAAVPVLAISVALAASPVPPRTLAAINSQVRAVTHAQACDMVNFLPAYYEQAPGVAGHVAVGILDIDPENCGANFVMTSLAVYRVKGGRIQPVALPAYLRKYNVQKVDAVTPEHGGLRIMVSYFGPGDPMCCANHKLSVFVRV
ncbi:hypothetical protein FE249_20520 (plasmid) [Acidiphilium multivorum]|uniref:hypothetical protein n=1 Tax=Acidiphilium multivorum TaxID=62140 RepID=UPI001F4BE773|nr:hypothetical protein [Acidiphilium multivorum]UNC16560.1 hypothetical protein FE249_20520 [Acidiphilium multivorum]